jgi:hypothetical protein
MTTSTLPPDRVPGHTAGRRLLAITLVANVTLMALVSRVARDPSWHTYPLTAKVSSVLNATLLVAAVVCLGLTIRRRPDRVSGWLFAAVPLPVVATVVDWLIAWEISYSLCE